MKMTDLGTSPGEPMKSGDKPRKYYPSARVPLAAIKGAPTDGKEFMATVKCCVRSVDNRDDAADIELKGISVGHGDSGDAGDDKSRTPRRSLSESVQKAKAEASGEEY